MARTNRTAYVVLGLLAERPLSGYELKGLIDEVIGHFWREGFGTIYPVLSQLQRRGWVRRDDRRGARARRRLVNRITAPGRRALAAWLATAPEPETVRNELLLRVFFGRQVAPDVLRRHIQAFAARNRERRAYFAAGGAEIKTLPEPERTFWVLTLRSGLGIVNARLRWAEDALRRLAKLRRSRRR